MCVLSSLPSLSGPIRLTLTVLNPSHLHQPLHLEPVPLPPFLQALQPRTAPLTTTTAWPEPVQSQRMGLACLSPAHSVLQGQVPSVPALCPLFCSTLLCTANSPRLPSSPHLPGPSLPEICRRPAATRPCLVLGQISGDSAIFISERDTIGL